MRNVILFGLLIITVGCSSPPIRSKWADKNMRVMIDPDSISPTDYVAIQNALVQEDKFMVVDRGAGFRAVLIEQQRQHRVQNDRFSDREKWSHWGKLYGVGAIVVAHSQCFKKKKIFSFNPLVTSCKQFLSLVDSNSGEVIVAVDGENETPTEGNNFGSESFKQPSDWKLVVAEFVDAYPKVYKPQHYSEGLVQYQQLSEEEALRQKETRSNASEK